MTSLKTKLRQFVAAIFATFNRSRYRRIVAASFAAFAIFLVSAPATAQTFDNVWHVDEDAPGGDGETWVTAFNNLQDALDEADEAQSPFGTDLIKVAQGGYIPTVETSPGNPRSVTFSLNGSNFNNITIEGGYAGINEPNEPDPDVRDVELYVTTLSGEIGAAGLEDNAYHVMTIQDVDITVRIDGLRLVDGYADGDPGQNHHRGGGILIIEADPLIVDCTIFNCTAIEGGAMAVLVFEQFGFFAPNLVNCRFLGGQTLFGGDGGGIFNYAGSPQLTNCILSGCAAGGEGGAIYNGGAPMFSAGHSTLVNCTLSLNVASAGGGIYNLPSAGGATVTNCILWGNSNGQIDGGTATVTYTCIEGGHAGDGNITSDPQFLDADGLNEIPGDEDDDVRLALGSPCNDAGSNAALPPDIADLDADDDLTEPTSLDFAFLVRAARDATVGDPCLAATVDMGAHENADCQPNGDRDEDELAGNDANFDGIPDDCQDCNGNGVLDPEEIAGCVQCEPECFDCNFNGIPDECDIANGCLTDADGNGIPDECEIYGTNLRQLAPQPSGNGRGLAFDGTYLYYTKKNVGGGIDPNIYQITTDGVAVATITPSCPGGGGLENRQIGALAFDDTGPIPTLWAATFDLSLPVIYQLDIATGEVLQSIDSLPFNPDDFIVTAIDGLAFDPRDNSLFYSLDRGVEVFNIIATGGSDCNPEPAQQNQEKGFIFPEGDVSGHAFDGMFLYIGQPDDISGAPNEFPPPQIFRTYTDSPEFLLHFQPLRMGGGQFLAEDLAFDNVTFAPKCVVWGNDAAEFSNRIAAFEVPCQCADPCPADLDGDCVVGVKDLLILLGAWGTNPGHPADFDDSGAVGVKDLLFLLGAWGPCPCAPHSVVLSLAEELANACLTQANWDEFEAVMTDPDSSQEDKDRYDCWMTHYLEHCNKCTCAHEPVCFGPDPFE